MLLEVSDDPSFTTFYACTTVKPQLQISNVSVYRFAIADSVYGYTNGTTVPTSHPPSFTSFSICSNLSQGGGDIHMGLESVRILTVEHMRKQAVALTTRLSFLLFHAIFIFLNKEKEKLRWESNT